MARDPPGSRRTRCSTGAGGGCRWSCSAAAIVAEGLSFRTAVRESNRTRGRQSWPKFIRSAKAPELPVILLEDFAALIGLVFALLRGSG